MLAAASERRFYEIELPGLRSSFANYSDEQCADIVAGKDSGKPIRTAAFKRLLEDMLPSHMRDGQAKDKPEITAIEGLSPSVARGIQQAIKDGVSHTHWIKLAPHYQRIIETPQENPRHLCVG